MSSAGVEEPPTGSGLPALDAEVRFEVEMSGGHSTADVASIIQAIDDLAVGGVWGALASGFSGDPNEPNESVMHALRQATADAYEHSRVAECDMVASAMIETALAGRGYETAADNWTLTAGSATNQWLKRELAERADELYEEVFSFAAVEHLEHSSPLIIVVVIAPVVGVGGAAWAVAKGIKWVYRVRKDRAAARREEAEARIARAKAALVEQAVSELKGDPELMAKVQDVLIDRLLPGAEALITHPQIERVALTSGDA
jgi:hypothetical protein